MREAVWSGSVLQLVKIYAALYFCNMQGILRPIRSIFLDNTHDTRLELVVTVEGAWGFLRLQVADIEFISGC